MSSTLPVPVTSFADVEALVKGTRTEEYLTTAVGIVLFYDYFLVLPDEVEYVWRSRPSVATTLYYINRYLPLPTMGIGLYYFATFPAEHSDQSCRDILLIQPIMEIISYLAASWLLLLRVLALFREQRPLCICLIVAFVSTHIVNIALNIRVLHNAYPSIQYSFLTHLCVGRSFEEFDAVYFALIPLEIILMMFLVYHLLKYRRLLEGESKISTLLLTIYADGTIYFILVVGLRLAAALVYTRRLVAFYYSVAWAEFSFSSLVVSRLFLHLRRVAAPSFEPSLISTQISTHFESTKQEAPTLVELGQFHVRRESQP